MKVKIEDKQDTRNVKLGDIFSNDEGFYLLSKSISNDKFPITLLNLGGNTEWDSWFDMNEFLMDEVVRRFRHYSKDDYEIVLKRKQVERFLAIGVGNEMRFVGIDPSTAGTGLTILNHKGEVVEAISLKAIANNDDDPKRFRDLANRLRKHMNPSTDRVLIEGFSLGSSGRGVSIMFGVGWLIRDMLNEHGFKWLDIPPKTLKKFISNNGNAKKADLIEPTKEKWGFEHKSNDVIDSYGLARIGYSMYNHEGLLKYEQDILRKLKKI